MHVMKLRARASAGFRIGFVGGFLFSVQPTMQTTAEKVKTPQNLKRTWGPFSFPRAIKEGPAGLSLFPTHSLARVVFRPSHMHAAACFAPAVNHPDLNQPLQRCTHVPAEFPLLPAPLHSECAEVEAFRIR